MVKYVYENIEDWKYNFKTSDKLMCFASVKELMMKSLVIKPSYSYKRT